MKKKFIVVIILCLCLLLSSCKKEEYGVIELSGGELTEFLHRDEEPSYSIVFALYAPDTDDNGNKFKEDLEKVARRTKTLIYLVDYDHIDFMSAFLIDEIAPNKNCYFVYQDGQQIVSEEYSDYDTLYKNLNGKKFYPDIEFNSDEYIEEALDNAEKSYDDGYITSSLNYLYLIWNTKEAKEFYEDHENFKLIHFWEGYIPTGDSENMHYFGLEFGFFFNTVTIYDKMDKVEGFEKPDVGKMYFYYYKDGYLYLSETEDGEYKKSSYKIESFTKDRIYVKVKDITLGMYYVY